MTATVTVRTRAWPATVTTGGETIEVGTRSETSFNVEDSQDFSVKINPPDTGAGEESTDNLRPFEGEPVPGRAENDALIQPAGGRRSKLFGDDRQPIADGE